MQSGSASPSSSQTSTAPTATATLDRLVAASPSPSASSGSPAALTELCVSVQRSQASVQRGKKASYVIQTWTQNGSAANVSVALTSQPAAQKPTFTSGCGKGNGTAACAFASVSDKNPVSADAQIPVAANATSVTSVKLTVTASIVTSEKWTPPAATETVTVTSASASASASASSSSAGSASPTSLPLGPIPNLNGVSSSLIGAGDASGLFPAIIPSASPSPSPGIQPQGGKQNASPVSESSTLATLGKPVLTAQVAGLIALAIGVLLAVTRLSLGKRFRSRKQDS